MFNPENFTLWCLWQIWGMTFGQKRYPPNLKKLTLTPQSPGQCKIVCKCFEKYFNGAKLVINFEKYFDKYLLNIWEIFWEIFGRAMLLIHSANLLRIAEDGQKYFGNFGDSFEKFTVDVHRCLNYLLHGPSLKWYVNLLLWWKSPYFCWFLNITNIEHHKF